MAGSSYGIPEDALLSLGSMEGVYELPVVEKRVAAVATPRRESFRTGYLLAFFAATLAYAVHYLPFPPFRLDGGRRPVSAAIVAIVFGVLIRNLLRDPSAVIAGSKNLVKRVIPVTIVLTAAGLDLARIASVGPGAIAVAIASIGIAMGAAVWGGRALGLNGKTSVLLGAGTAICGTSAIVAVAPLIDAHDEDVTLSVGAVSLLGLILMFALPPAGALLGLSDAAFGIWAGTSIHAVPQVVAAGFAYSDPAGSVATLVKLFRVTLLAPFMFVLMFVYARTRPTVTVHYSRFVPPFVWGFLGVTLASTLSLFPTLRFEPARWIGATQYSLPLGPLLVEAGSLLLTLAMAALGLEVDFRKMTGVGGKALAAGSVAAIALCAVSLALIRLIGA